MQHTRNSCWQLAASSASRGSTLYRLRRQKVTCPDWVWVKYVKFINSKTCFWSMPGTYEAIPLLTLIHKLACGKLRTRTIITNVPKTESSLCRIFVNQHVTQGPEIARIQAVVGQIFLGVKLVKSVCRKTDNPRIRVDSHIFSIKH